MKNLSIGKLWYFISLIIFSACTKDTFVNKKIDQPMGPTPYALNLPGYFPEMPVPEDNPLTVEGVELGRRLFYDPILSGDNTQSCASCHQQASAFTDNGKRFSKGIDGFEGGRNTMPVLNLAWSSLFNWDGRFKSLEEQVPNPILLQFEMHQNLYEALDELRKHPDYPEYFEKAFGDKQITVDRLAKSISQFMRTIYGGSPKMLPGLGQQLRTPAENRGFQVFIDETKGDCFHCHEVSIFTTNFKMINNGLVANTDSDPGLYAQTGNPEDKGKFKVPSLINLKYTAPYMHDGRFSSLDVNLKKHTDANQKPVPRSWTAQDKKDLIAFLLCLEDTTVLRKVAYSKP
jgi:cytochrome c peroxidase